MNINLVVLLGFILPASLQGQAFITTWNTANPGVSSPTSIEIPVGGGIYDYDVDWDNDGVFDELNINGSITHDFGVAGTYTIRIQGDFPSIQFNNGGDKDKIVDISQWGSIQWESFENAFQGCSNLDATATDSPILTSVLNYSFAFQLASKFNGGVSNWDVSSAQNMRGMFWGASEFNGNVSNWDISNVTDMAFMFFLASSFNKDLTNWDVSNVTLMSQMFASANVFNGDLTTWSTTNVNNMAFMFSDASAFDQDLGGWDITQVTDMSNMLSNTALSIENYDNILIGWESQNVMQNVTLGVDGLDYCEGAAARSSLSAVATNNWNIVGDNEYCPYFITTWKTDFPGSSNATSIAIPTFGGGYDYDVDWNNDGIFDEFGINGSVTHDFGIAGIYTIQIRGDFPRIHFDNTGDKDKIITLNQWGEIEWSSMAAAFYGCSNLNYAATDAPNLTNVTSMASMFQGATIFNGNISNWDVSHITTMAFTFRSASSFNQDLNSWDVSSVTDMSRMFNAASSFNGDLNNWHVHNVTNMSRMFESAVAFNKSISNWNVSKVTDMSYMFRNADAFNQPISTWNVSSVTNMSNQFSSANDFNQDLGGWDVSSVTNMAEMLSYSGISQVNYDNILIGWAGNIVQNGVALGAQGLTYCDGEAARSNLLNSYAWTITGDNKNCSFITTWKTDNLGDSPDNAITIPITGVGYNYDVDWNNDGIFDQFGIVGSVSHVFPAPGTYTIRIRGDFPRIYFNTFGDCNKIINIAQWGDIEWTSMERSFYGCSNLTSTATDAPDLSNVNDLSNMFKAASLFNGDVSLWDVSNVTNMREMFRSASVFNGDLSNWDVSSVTDMGLMFESASLFNSDISTWNVSNVTEMDLMFLNALEFNIDISGWDVSNVTKMNSMFSSAKKFNQDLDSWDVSSVTNMGAMFYNAEEFNGNISSWDVSAVTNIFFMFANADKFEGDISNWDVSNVTNMEVMFSGADLFNGDLSNWNVSAVQNMKKMFNNAISFDQNLGAWNITAVTNMTDMLNNTALSTENYDNTLIGWSTQNVQNSVTLGADGLTYCAGETPRLILILNRGWSFIGDSKECAPFITTWKTDNPGNSPNNAITIPVTGGGYNYDVDWNNDGIFDQFGIAGSVSHIFPAPGTYTIRIRGDFPRIYFNNAGDKEKIINIDQWGDIEWTSMEGAFWGCHNLNSSASDVPDLSNVTNMSNMFASALVFNGDISGWDVSNVVNMTNLFQFADSFTGDVSNWDVSNVTDMARMFWSVDNFNSDLSNWDVSNVTKMDGMFAACELFNSDISNWDVSNVTDMTQMFAGAKSFNQDISNWNVSNVIKMRAMFKQADVFNIDIGNWDVSKVDNMAQMFWAADVFNQNISGWNISNVLNLSMMFRGALVFNQDIGNWNTSSVTDISSIFAYTVNFNQDLSNWDVSNVTDMVYAFQSAEAFNQDLGEWNIAAVTTMENMLSDCGMSQENYDNTLIGWSNQNVQQNVLLGAESLLYCLGEDARFNLTNTYNWAITGDQLDCSILPVELLYFNAEKNANKHVDLSWSTSLEINNDFFTVERSKDGTRFEYVENVFGAGNSNQTNMYTSTDTKPYNGLSYYRLKQTDFEGNISYSETEAVKIDVVQNFSFYPNPIRDVLHIVGDGYQNETVFIKIFDSLGNLKYDKHIEINENIISFDINEVSDFSAGNYFMTVQNGRQTQTFSLIKV